MKKVNQMGKRAAFTIVELLTVMAVIAILIGLLVPALGLVADTAHDLQQKAQFHGIKVGLELFKTEYGEYPESDDNQFDAINPTQAFTGANKLAEAMVGLDLMGFHPSSEFRADGMGADPLDPLNLIQLYSATTLNDREERLVDLQKANAVRLEDIYSVSTAPMEPTSYVLCDNFKKRRTGTVNNKKTGMPILYYRANTRFKIQDSSSTTVPPTTIYNYRDNMAILDLGLADGSGPHDLNTDIEFDEAIINKQIETADVPYNAQSFILMSAGRDGIYGTADDVFNFDKEI